MQYKSEMDGGQCGCFGVCAGERKGGRKRSNGAMVIGGNTMLSLDSQDESLVTYAPTHIHTQTDTHTTKLMNSDLVVSLRLSIY